MWKNIFITVAVLFLQGCLSNYVEIPNVNELSGIVTKINVSVVETTKKDKNSRKKRKIYWLDNSRYGCSVLNEKSWQFDIDFGDFLRCNSSKKILRVKKPNGVVTLYYRDDEDNVIEKKVLN